MIVPADREPDYPSPARRYSAGRGTRGYSEPFLQRWLFSRRILAVLAVIVVATATWWLVSGRYFSVPKATGMPVAAARAELTSAGLVVEIGKAKYSDTVAKGEVIATYPGAGQSVTRGSQITIIPSLGPVMVTMPNVTGQTVSVAEQTLRAAGLKVGKPVYQASSIQPGIVISTNPVAYSQWAKDKPIQLVVSAGPPLPNFVGQLLTAAQQQAQQGGYAIDAVTVASSSQPAGIVLSQSPQPGTPIAPGEVVVLQVSPGPAMVTVPNVIGMTEHEAVKTLEEAGFVPQIQGGTFGGRTVTDYSPQGQQPQGSTILVIIGLGL